MEARSIWTRALDAAGIVATPLLPSHYVELFDPLRATHVRRARVEAVLRETERTRTFVLRPGPGWRAHRAGQFVAVGVELDGRILTRTYSISSSPERRDGRFTITVTALEGGRVSNALVRRARPGDYLRIGLPQGDFTMPEPAPSRVLFVTGGSGITPVRSMVQDFATRGAMPDVVHLHYARAADDVIFGAELAQLARDFPSYRFIPVITTRTGPHARATREFGPEHQMPLFDRGALEDVAPDFAGRAAWACGPESLLDAVAAVVPSVRVERFKARLAPCDPTACGGRVRFARSKKELDAGGATPLLQAAERAGVDAPHGCRIGICHSCDATMLSGAVRDLRTGKRIDEPGARIQPCVCAAAGDVEIDL